MAGTRPTSGWSMPRRNGSGMSEHEGKTMFFAMEDWSLAATQWETRPAW